MGLRFHQYFLDRSLWIDEAFLALNILERSYAELLEPLAYNQAAPIGFLLVEKFFVRSLGNSELVLRLFPFICGIAALFLCYVLARRLSHPLAAAVAVGLFALCDRAIYYSAEVKQYSSDVAIALILLLLALRFVAESKSTPWRDVALFSVIGAIAIWCSHPSAFIIAGTGLCVLILAARHRNWTQFVRCAIAFGTCGLSFAAFYTFSLRQIASNPDLQSSWDESHGAFMPLPPSSLTDLKWFFDTFFKVFDYPVGIHLTGIAALVFLIGCAALWKTRPTVLCLLMSPIALTLVASGLHQYPFKGQLLLFAVPLILLVIGEGVREIFENAGSTLKAGAIVLAALLFSHPLYYVALNLNAPQIPPSFEYQRVREDIQPVLEYVATHREADDTIYLYYASGYAFRYYAAKYGFSELVREPEPEKGDRDWFAPALASVPPRLIVGSVTRYDRSSFVEKDLPQLQGRSRVWVVFSHVRDRRSTIDEETVLLHQLSRDGQQLDDFQSVEASVYLFDFSGEPSNG